MHKGDYIVQEASGILLRQSVIEHFIIVLSGELDEAFKEVARKKPCTVIYFVSVSAKFSI
jgi:hypothetical protein